MCVWVREPLLHSHTLHQAHKHTQYKLQYCTNYRTSSPMFYSAEVPTRLRGNRVRRRRRHRRVPIVTWCCSYRHNSPSVCVCVRACACHIPIYLLVPFSRVMVMYPHVHRIGTLTTPPVPGTYPSATRAPTQPTCRSACARVCST